MIHATHLPSNAWHILNFQYVLQGKAAQVKAWLYNLQTV